MLSYCFLMKGCISVRVTIANDALSTPQMIDRLRKVVDAAYYGGAPRRWIRVTVVLGGNYGGELWHWEKCHYANGTPVPNCGAPRGAIGLDARPNPWRAGDTGFYTRPVPGMALNMLEDAWLDWGHTAYYKQHAISVVTAFRDHPGIFGWNITNEVNSSGTPFAVGLLVNFYRNMAKTIRENDPNHLITTGLISTSWANMTDSQRDAVYLDPNIDYLTVHAYDGPTVEGHEYINGNHQIDDIWRANRRYDKPVIIQEFGMSGVNAFERVKTYMTERFIGPDADLRVDAIMPFGVTSNETAVDWGTGDTPFSPRSQNMIRPYQAMWARWTGQLDPRLPLIVDNDNSVNDPSRAKFESSGAWGQSAYSGERWGANYHTTTTNNGATGEDGATFKFYLAAPACKGIDARWNANYSRSNTAPFVVYDANNNHLGTAYKNQQLEGDRWINLGTWCFTAGWNRVTLSRWSPAPGHLIADAIRVR